MPLFGQGLEEIQELREELQELKEGMEETLSFPRGFSMDIWEI